ncbi:acyl dehydratase [Rhodoblastus acidophilus]|uniref:MaoC/PaaZ C-terminal domain-containing protein n=1 Tax=Rhodoblastus acidophilus TaxID=1074 RepID=UPI002224FFAC|nr:MaoC/PaaZ C-terminal domain-containing protein [Rhodoblastus acidophilus]MCW2315930.1 acyl dehydratase [Rhodoblastus acidophilus]
MSLIHFEDFTPGETRTYGAYRFTEEAIIAFAAEYDAQTFHMDAELAKHSLLGGLAASGWHTCSALMRMMTDDWLGGSACLAGIGIEDNRWLAPVRPGDVLRAETRTLEKTDLRSRLDAGVVKFETILRNQDGVEVMRQVSSILFGRREPLAAPPAETAPRPIPPEPPPRIDDRFAALPDDYRLARVGAYADLGEKQFSAAFIRAYAQEFDPFPFHLDEAEGRKHVLGAMSAAGLQTACCWMRQFIALRREVAGGDVPSRASPGFANLVWRKPVLVGDRIRFSTQVIAKRPTSKPGLGLVQSLNRAVNQRGALVMEFTAAVITPIVA